MHLPPYSPDLNPIESCWAFVKNLLRKARARLEPVLREAIRRSWLILSRCTAGCATKTRCTGAPG